MNGHKALIDLLSEELIDYEEFESIDETADRILKQAREQLMMQENQDLPDGELLIYTIAKRMEAAAVKIIDTYKADALEQAKEYLKEGKKSGDFMGIPVQIRTITVWQYPEDDAPRMKYLEELDQHKQKVAGLTKALKDREKALQDEGKAAIIEEKESLTIKSS